MNIFSQAGLFLSAKPDDHVKLHDHYKNNYSNYLRAKALGNLRLMSKVTNIARKIVNFICLIFTLGFKKNVAGSTLSSKQFQVKYVKLTHQLLALEKGAINLQNGKAPIAKYNDEAICILINDITEDNKIDRILEIIEHPLFDLQRMNNGSGVVKLLNKEKNKQEQIDTFHLMMDIANGRLSYCKKQLMNLSDVDKQKLVKYFLCEIHTLEFLKKFCEIFPDSKAETIGKLSNWLFISLMIQSTADEFHAGEYANVFDKDLIDAEIKRRLVHGNYELFVPTGQTQNDFNIIDKKKAYADIQDRILSVLNTVDFKVNTPQRFFERTHVDDLKKLLVTATVFNYPEPLKLEINKRLKRVNVDWYQRPTPELSIDHYVDDLAAVSYLDRDLIKDWVQEAFTLFYNLPEQVDQADLDHLLLLFKEGNRIKFLEQLDAVMSLYNISRDLMNHIKECYDYYYVIKKYYNTIIQAWNDQNMRGRRGIWCIPEIALPLHFENYNNEKFLKNALDNYFGALEQILISGIDKDDLKNAFLKGFVAGTNCLEARSKNMEEKYLQHEYGDPDYMPSFDEQMILAANLTNYLATYRNWAARRYVKDHYAKYPGVNFNSDEWKGERKLRYTVLQSDEFFDEFMTVDQFKAYLERKEFFNKFIISKETGVRAQVLKSDVDEELQKWVTADLLVN